MRKRITLIAVGSLATVCTAGSALVLSTSASAHYSALSHRPSVTRRTHGGITNTASVSNVNQQFQTANSGWCIGGGNPCDGNSLAMDYGTIDSGIPTGFSNGGFGNYAPSTPALFSSKMAVISGSTQANQSFGCQTPGTEGCTGPYYVPPTTETSFPGGGFTVTVDIYLDPSASVGNAAEIDPDVGLNTSTNNPTYGYYGQDMIFAVCNQGGGTGYSVTFGHNSPGDCSGPPVITTAGWYRFVWIFSNVGGYVYLTQKVFDDSPDYTNPTLVTSSAATPVIFPGDSSVEPVANVGGLGYIWFPTLQVSGMPMANFAVQTGQHAKGHNP